MIVTAICNCSTGGSRSDTQGSLAINPWTLLDPLVVSVYWSCIQAVRAPDFYPEHVVCAKKKDKATYIMYVP